MRFLSFSFLLFSFYTFQFQFACIERRSLNSFSSNIKINYAKFT